MARPRTTAADLLRKRHNRKPLLNRSAVCCDQHKGRWKSSAVDSPAGEPRPGSGREGAGIMSYRRVCAAAFAVAAVAGVGALGPAQAIPSSELVWGGVVMNRARIC